MKFEETLDRYLAETALRKSSKSLQEVRDKLFCIQRLKELFSELKDFIIEEGLPDTEKEEPIFFDFVMRREEIKLGIFIEVTETCPTIETERLNALNKKLNQDPAIDSVVIVWNDKNLSTCALDSLALKSYFGRTERSIELEREKKGGFVEIVTDFYDQQFVDWFMPEDFKFPETPDLGRPRIIEWAREKLLKGFQEQIKLKRFRKKEKQVAQNEITETDVSRIASFLQNILSKQEISPEDLEPLENFYTRTLEKE